MALMKAFLRFRPISSSLCRHTSTVACADSGASAASELHNLSSPASAEAEKAVRNGPRNDWTKPEIQAVYDSPIMDLLFHGAKEAGSTRFCMGVAWRDTVGRKTNFNQILDYVKEIRGLGMEVRCTLGMLEKQQAEDLKKAGLTAYNHNLDTSREFYPSIITTRSYDERLKTLEFVREAGISVRSASFEQIWDENSKRL